MEGADRSTRGAQLVAIAAYAAAVAAACELAFVLAAARSEARAIAPAACVAAAVALAAGFVVGSAAALALRDAAVAAFGVPLAALALFALANGALPAVHERALPAGIVLLAAGVSLAAGALIGRLIDRERVTSRVIIVAPPFVSAFGFEALFLAEKLGASPEGHLAWAFSGVASLAGAVAATAILRAKRAPSVALTQRLAWISVGSLALAIALTSIVWHPPATVFGARSSRPPDVLLVVLDTVRADAAPAPDSAPLPTPALARLAREGTRFTNAFSTSCWTLPAHASLFTGLTARAHGTGWQDPYLPGDLETAAETFGRAGYRTAGFSANVWVSPEFGLDRGFERFTMLSAADRPPAPWALRVMPSLFASLDAALPFDDKGGSSLASAALRFLAARDDRPAFVFLNLLEAHMPYAPPERWLRRIATPGRGRRELLTVSQAPLQGLLPGSAPSAAQLDALRALYHAEVAYDDEILGQLLDALRAAGRLDNTIVAVLSDHGENLGDHAPLDHQLGVWDSLIHVPLIVRAPGRVPAGATRDDLVSLVDVSPAIRALAGIESRTPAGSPIAGGESRAAVFFSYDRPGEVLDRIRAELGIDPAPWDRRLDGIRSATAKWIVASDGSAYAFDLTRDPGETANLAAGPKPGAAAAPPAGFGEVSSSLAKEIAASPLREPRRKTMSDETRRRLRSLGYVH